MNEKNKLATDVRTGPETRESSLAREMHFLSPESQHLQIILFDSPTVKYFSNKNVKIFITFKQSLYRIYSYKDGFVDFKEFAMGLLILGGNSASQHLEDETLDFVFRFVLVT